MQKAAVMVIAFTAITGNAYAQTIEPPVPTQGDNWQFQTINLWTSNLASRFTKKTLGVSGDYVRSFFENQTVGENGEVAKPVVNEATSRADMNQTVMYRGEKQERTWYRWPLVPGKKWTFQIKEEIPPATAGGQTRTVTSTVNAEATGMEAVEVPAGKFNAMKIVYKTTWQMDSPTASGSSTSTAWYAPDAKATVQTIFESFGPDGSPQARTKSQLIHYMVK